MAESASHRERPSSTINTPGGTERPHSTGQQSNINAEEAARRKRVWDEQFERGILGGKTEAEMWHKAWEKIKDNPAAFFRAANAERRKSPEYKEFNLQEQQSISMGEIGAKLAELKVGAEERRYVFEKLARNPESITDVADVLKTIPQGDNTLAQAYMKAAEDEISRLIFYDPLKYPKEMERLKWWELLLLTLAAILSAPGKATAETGKEPRRQAA